MFKITTASKVDRLLDYYNRVKLNQWFLLGNTSPWNNESLPPAPSSDITSIIQPHKFFRVLTYKPVYISSTGDIQTGNYIYQSVPNFNRTTLIDLKVSSLLIKSTVTNSDIGNITYRSIGICNNLSSNPLNINIIPHSLGLTYDLDSVVYFTAKSTSNTLQSNVIQFVMDF